MSQHFPMFWSSSCHLNSGFRIKIGHLVSFIQAVILCQQFALKESNIFFCEIKCLTKIQLRALGWSSSVGKQCLLGDSVNITVQRQDWRWARGDSERERVSREEIVFFGVESIEQKSCIMEMSFGHFMDSHFNFY